jgi:hypothetical protein
MNPTFAPELAAGLTFDLRAFTALCENILSLVTRENLALAKPDHYQSADFSGERKRLLPALESTLMRLKEQRQAWAKTGRSAAQSEAAKSMFQNLQGLLMKILSLDRENQQALLRLGLVPARHLPPVAAQQPHFVAGLYRQHSSGHNGGRP